VQFSHAPQAAGLARVVFAAAVIRFLQRGVNMNPEDGHAANFARKMSSVTSSEYANLRGMMCWDAVMYCALKAGIITRRNLTPARRKTRRPHRLCGGGRTPCTGSSPAT
jgi:hypothetical protein